MSLLSYTFVNEQTLYAAYMPFIQGGGLFIRVKPSEEMTLQLGDTVALEITLPNDTSIYKTSGRVVWITPVGAQGGRPAGYGVALLGEEGTTLKNKIVKQISALLKAASLPTDTM